MGSAFYISTILKLMERKARRRKENLKFKSNKKWHATNSIVYLGVRDISLLSRAE